MNGTRRDYSILNRFRFQWKPVGMKYLLNRPEGMPKLDTSMPICRMFREAQDRDPFFAAGDNFTCMERLLLGMMEPEPFFESGEIGAKEKIYQEPRANRRIYDEVPKLAKNSVRYVAFSSIDKVSFEPDVMVITANTEQAEIVLRALNYSSGKPLTTKITPVLTCAWIFVYPYVTGETNYTITGLGYGIRLQKLLPEGLLLISIPFDRIPMLIENLKEMEWILPITTLNEEERGQYSMKVMEEINLEYKNG